MGEGVKSIFNKPYYMIQITYNLDRTALVWLDKFKSIKVTAGTCMFSLSHGSENR